MSNYAGQAGLQADYAFQQRVGACVTQETGAWLEDPLKPVPEIVSEIMPAVAASPGFAEKYTWGDQTAGLVPGQAAITDAELLGAVQPMLDQYRPPTGG